MLPFIFKHSLGGMDSPWLVNQRESEVPGAGGEEANSPAPSPSSKSQTQGS